MNNSEYFQKNKYCVVKNSISPEMSSICKTYTLFDEKNNFAPERYDAQVPGAHSEYGDLLMESLLINLLPLMEQNTGLSLWPTYSYYRVYRSGDKLVPHKDRESCEISATLCLGYNYPDDYIGWPIFLEDVGFIMEPGDMIIYRGTELTHFREPFDIENNIEKNYFHSQVFLHYVDKNGPYENYKFDGRQGIGI